jgi:chemotaxis signal transduction protein
VSDADRSTAARPGAADDADTHILRERARVLARPPARTRAAGRQHVVFRLAGERYAAPLEDTVLIMPVGEIVPLPGVRAPLIGVAPWRGALLAVADLRLLAGTSAGLPDITRLVILGDDAGSVGVLAEAVEEIRPIDTTDMGSVEVGTGDAVRGITHDAVLVLDPQRLLAIARGG